MATSVVATWPTAFRIIILLNVGLYNFIGNVYNAGVPPLFALLIQDFHISTDDASKLVTYVLLAFGLSNIFALPAIALIGKRFTILTSLVLFLAACIWSGEATSYNSLLASRIVGGLCGGLIEALGPGIVLDVFPEHQLARAMVVYVGLLAAGSSVGPIIAGAVAEHLQSWRWFHRIVSIITGVILLSSILMLPETTAPTRKPTETPQTETGVDGSDASEKRASREVENILHENDGGPHVEDKRTFFEQWMAKSFSPAPIKLDWKLALRCLYQPYELIVLPQVLATTLLFGLTIGWTVLVSVIVAPIYSAPPLLWTPLKVGFLNFGPLTGLIIGIPLGGALADMLYNRAVRRTAGTPDPRVRLPATLIGAIASPVGCLVLGFSLRHPADWAPVTVGWALLSLGLTSSANIMLTYAVDTLPSRASHIGMLVNLSKNCLAFGVSYTSVSWMETMGSVGQFGTMAGLLWFAYLLIIPVWIWSPRIVSMSIKLFEGRV
ncbi:MFS general substrate transporter [Sarocladium strictum]